jgi:hypothetical protein
MVRVAVPDYPHHVTRRVNRRQNWRKTRSQKTRPQASCKEISILSPELLAASTFNARLQQLAEAGVLRTLEAVGCRPLSA